MAKKEDPVDLQRQKEDIENLLSSLENAFSEGTITQEHYNEVKQKNEAKLQEITKKLQKTQKQTEKEAAPVEELPKKPKKQELPPEEPKPEEKETKKPAETPRAIDEKEGMERVKEKVLFDLSPKIEKMSVKIEKLKAFVDALKEEKAGDREAIQHLNEELGEIRSLTGSMEGRMSEVEMKLEDVAETLADLKPQRFSKELQKKEEEIKLHEARLEKLDDMNSTILKRVNQIQVILEKLGNIESIADMTKEISKKLMSIDEREKKITRLADKIDSMFVEINKRLEEFMFYKAKQDSFDDLSKEMLKSIDELTTKLTRYAERDDLELLRDTLENRIHSITKEMETAAPSVQVQQEKSEVESLMKLLDEQYRKGQISRKDYEKAKEANMQKIREMEEKTRVSGEPAPIAPPPIEPIIEERLSAKEERSASPIPPTTAPQEKNLKEEPISQRKEEPKPLEESGLAQAAKIAQPPAEPRSIPKQPAQEKPETKPEPIKEEPAPEQEKPKPGKTMGKKEKMLSDLESSYRKGLISRRAYETAQRMITAKKF